MTNKNPYTMKVINNIRCINNGKLIQVPTGCTLEEAYQATGLKMDYGPIVALVNNKVEGMHYRIFYDKDVEFLDITSSSGLRCYTRTVFFVLCKAAHELFNPQCHVAIDIPVSNGYYVDLQIGRPVTLDDVGLLRRKMQEIIDRHLPIHRYETTTEEAIKMWGGDPNATSSQPRNSSANSKVKLLRSIGKLYTTYYDLDGYHDYFYGSMLTNTSQIYLFGLEKYYDGLLLRLPSRHCPSELGEMVMQDKMFAIFQEHHRWQDILGLRTIGDLNEATAKGLSSQLILISEALQEKKISQIADDIKRHQGVRLVLIAGPSSSGKTTACKRLSVQLAVNGIKPIPISLDDYFLDREKTPLDEKGEYDFENIHALNLPLLNEQFAALFRGEEVELPRYDFPTGRSLKSGRRLQLKEGQVLVVEGIHALNPELTAQIPEEQKYRVYASALTTILLDTHNYIPTTDNRLLRRIIRDVKYRGASARDTIHRWPSVRAGENKWIFPYQENADVMFNSAMIYELAVIRSQAEPALEQVPENCEEYAEAYRLRKFLRYFAPLPFDALPPTSLLREFLGGSTFSY